MFVCGELPRVLLAFVHLFVACVFIVCAAYSTQLRHAHTNTHRCVASWIFAFGGREYNLFESVDYLEVGQEKMPNEEYVDVKIQDKMKPFLHHVKKNFDPLTTR